MTKFLIPPLALRSRRQEWEVALAQAVQAEFPHGVRGVG
jgi:hypothetical protein